jgi:hypothetical protein
MPSTNRRPAILLCLLALLLAPSLARARQQAPITITATPLYEGNFIQGTWLPIRVSLKNTAGDARVRVQAEAPSLRATFALDVDLPGGASKDVTLYAQPDIGGDHVDVVALRDGGEIARLPAPARTRTGERMVLLASDQELSLPLPRREQLQALPFLPFSFPLAQLPDRAEGLATLTSVVVAGGDATALSDAQRLALASWVHAGGQLVLGGGPGAAATLNALPADLRPADVGATRQRLAGAALATDGITATLSAQLDGVALAPRAGATVTLGEAAPLVVELRVGQGRVQQLAFAPDDQALANWPGAPQFWDRLLRPLDPASAVTGGPGARLGDIREQALTIGLSNLPALDLPQPTLLIALFIAYFLVIGPGLYLLLRRLDRQLWGWLLIPATTLLFGAVAYGLGWGLRASDALVNTISVVEPLAGGGARARTLVGVYGSKEASYRIAFGGDALVRPLRSTSSRYGTIDGAPGSYAQGPGGETLVDVPGWGVRGVLAEASVALPELSYEILIGGDGIKARVQNPLDQPLRDVVISYGEQLVRLNDIPAGAEAVAPWPTLQDLQNGELPPQGTALGFLIYQQAISAGEAAGGVSDREVALRQTMVDALLSNGARPRERGPVLVAWLDNSPLAPSIAGGQSAAVGGATLLLGRPRIVANGPVRLGPGWLALDTTAQGVAGCITASGATGVQASSVPLTLTLSLPPELATLAPSKLSLTLAGDKNWPNAGVPTRLYNWQSARWDEQNFDGPGDLLAEQPQRYMRGGRVLVQLDGRIPEAGCITVSASVDGTMP